MSHQDLAPIAALIGLAGSLLLAIAGWGMPVGQALSATAEGAFYGAFPILWILVFTVLVVLQATVLSGMVP